MGSAEDVSSSAARLGAPLSQVTLIDVDVGQFNIYSGHAPETQIRLNQLSHIYDLKMYYFVESNLGHMLFTLCYDNIF